MLQYVVVVNYRRFCFDYSEWTDAFDFAKYAKLHSEDDIDVKIEVELVDQKQEKADND